MLSSSRDGTAPRPTAATSPALPHAPADARLRSSRASNVTCSGAPGGDADVLAETALACGKQATADLVRHGVTSALIWSVSGHSGMMRRREDPMSAWFGKVFAAVHGHGATHSDGTLAGMPDLEIHIERSADGGLASQARCEGCGEPSSRNFASPLRARDPEELRRYVEEVPQFLDAGTIDLKRRVEQRLIELGSEMSRLIAAGDTACAWFERARQVGGGRLCIVSSDPSVHGLPWELARLEQVPLHDVGIRVVRRLPGDGNGGEASSLEALGRVLLVVARPSGVGFLDPRLSAREVLNALDACGMEVAFCRPATAARVRETLDAAMREGNPVSLVHFDGHGVHLPSGRGALAFEAADGTLDLVDGERLRDTFSGVPIVLLDACQSADTEGTSWSAAAPTLLAAGVRSVVAMRYGVHVDMTRLLMRSLYEAIATGQPLSVALAGARSAVAADPWRRLPGATTLDDAVRLQDWFVPQLYQRSGDICLRRIEAQPSKTPPTPDATRSGGLPPPPRYGFADRPVEIHAIERRLLHAPSLNLFGMGGAGKTVIAAEAARWLVRTGMFPDGAVFTQFETGGGLRRALLSLCAHLGNETVDALPMETLRRRACELFRAHRVLVVWDNFESTLPAFGGEELGYDAAIRGEVQVIFEEWCRPGGLGRLLVTSRVQEIGLAAPQMELHRLSADAGITLIVRVLESRGLSLHQQQARGITSSFLRELGDRLSWHALSLELVAPSLARVEPRRALAELSGLLATASQVATEQRNNSLAASLEFSLRHLGQETRAALPALRLFVGGAHVEVMKCVVGQPPEHFERVRDELELLGLLRQEGPFYRLHPALPEAVGDANPDDATRHRFADVMRQICTDFYEYSQTEAVSFWATMMSVHEGAIRRALAAHLVAGNFGAWSVMLSGLSMFYRMTGRFDDAVRIAEFSIPETVPSITQSLLIDLHSKALVDTGDLDAAERLMAPYVQNLRGQSGREQELADMLSSLGIIMLRQGNVLAGIPLLEEALSLHLARVTHESDGINPSVMSLMQGLVNSYGRLGRFQEAETIARKGMRMADDAGRLNDYIGFLVGLGEVMKTSGRLAEAEPICREAVTLSRAHKLPAREGAALRNLGDLLILMGNPAAAYEELKSAITLFRSGQDTVHVASASRTLGHACSRLGRFDEALKWFQQALELARALRDAQSESEALADHGNTLRLLDRPAEALVEQEAALAMQVQLGLDRVLAETRANMAETLLELGRYPDAERAALAAAEWFRAKGHPLITEVYEILQRVAEARGDPAAAEAWRLVQTAELDEDAESAELVSRLKQAVFVALAVRRGKVSSPATPWLGADEEGPFVEVLRTQINNLATPGRQRPPPPTPLPDPIEEVLARAWNGVMES